MNRQDAKDARNSSNIQGVYDEVIAGLRESYDRVAGERDEREIAPWKLAERERFLQRLRQEGRTRLLEIGAGPGQDGWFFQESGLEVVCTDLSPENVRRCREKGLEAHEMDFLSLDFPPASFDALYAFNCLLHVPKRDLPRVLRRLREPLKPGGLFYLGQYGGIEKESPWPDDHHEPPRLFALYPDEQIQAIVSEFFELVEFTYIIPGEESELHFQAMVLRKPN